MKKYRENNIDKTNKKPACTENNKRGKELHEVTYEFMSQANSFSAKQTEEKKEFENS